MGFDISLPIRAVQAVFTIIVLGMSAYLTQVFTASYFDVIDDVYYSYQPRVFHFAIFTTVFTIFALAYLIIATVAVPKLANRIVMVAVDALCMLWWFITWVWMAAFNGTNNIGSCSARACQVSVADNVFAALTWVLFVATFLLSAVHVFRGRKSGGHHESKVEMGSQPTHHT